MAKHLTQMQRYYICLQIASGFTQASIAKRLVVSGSTVCREIKRNQRGANDYDSDYAHKKAQLKRANAKTKFKCITKRMEYYIRAKILDKWSPEQISGRMKIDLGRSVSHETIYEYVRIDKKHGGKLYWSLSHRGRKYTHRKTKGSNIIGRVDISKRPKIVDRKVRIGDFEIDTIVSAKSTAGRSCLLTMVDRRSKVTFIRKAANKSADAIQKVIEDIYMNTAIPILTITSDNGTEFANHAAISYNLECDFYFARPYCSWDRGLNEHTNGKIRRYVPKYTNFDTISEETVKQIENALNNRPRKALKYRTPNEVINKYLQRISRNQQRHKY